MNAAASADESDARARMERALKEVRDHASTLGAQGSTVLALVDRSQRAWKAYFDAEVELRWPPNAEDFGTIYPMCVATDMARMCNERARALGLAVLVEVHDADEVARAVIDAGIEALAAELKDAAEALGATYFSKKNFSQEVTERTENQPLSVSSVTSCSGI